MKKFAVGSFFIFLNVGFLVYGQMNGVALDEFSSAFDLFKQGDFQDAGLSFAHLYQAWPGDALAADSCFMAAQAYFNAGDYPSSYRLCEAFLRTYPGHSNIPDMEFQRGRILFKMQRFEEATRAFETFLKKYSDNALYPSALFWEAESFYQLGDIAHALPLFNEITEKWPGSDKASQAAWRLNVMGLEVREAKYSRLAAFESEQNGFRGIAEMQSDAYREQRYLREYFWLRALRRGNNFSEQPLSSVVVGNNIRDTRLNMLLNAKKRALDLLISKIKTYLREIEP
jgi:TolA-binding protein